MAIPNNSGGGKGARAAKGGGGGAAMAPGRGTADRQIQASHLQSIRQAPAKAQADLDSARTSLAAAKQSAAGNKTLLNASKAQLLQYSSGPGSRTPGTFEYRANQLYRARNAMDEAAKELGAAKAKLIQARKDIPKLRAMGL